ncbi:MAG: glycoside hydrolase family 65 [Planctomycetes bacterium RBG_16_55_9]|nr:MAG: glycoside hydrolase family 65 [Planctomycetes bacterium RBG_16_55_9]
MDRRALVTRHNITLTKSDPLTPLSVGNGEFAFTADITGLQTFAEYHEQGMPLGTQSQWAWHSLPNPDGYALSDVLESYDVTGRSVPYASDGNYPGGYSPSGNWLRSNPHRLHLGRIGLRLTKPDGSLAEIEDLSNTSQTLDLWMGLLNSRFDFDGQPVLVRTVCHPEQDTLAVRVESPLLGSGRLSVRLAFPYGSTEWRNSADWSSPDRHQTLSRISDGKAELTRILDSDRYYVSLSSPTLGQITTVSQHEYEIRQAGGQVLEAVFTFSPKANADPVPDFESVKADAEIHWRDFWNKGGAIDFSQCTDPRAPELERRVVLSQYLMAVNCAGSYPPQETGLVCNSWYGKFHLEMHWWHAAHFALWDRLELLERSLSWYQSIFPAARATAQMQGYKGVRWPKMTSPDGRESPSSVGVFLIWQQPHPIYYAELCYRTHKNRQTLERYREIVFETAEFMASYVVWDQANQRYVLGPALIPAQESYGPNRRTNLNPTFELAYWHWALETAQKWRQRLGMERDPKWEEVLSKLSRPHIREGVYTAIETEPFTIYRDHPSMVAAYGFLPRTPLIDPDIMKRTYDDVLQRWDWPSTWGWDYPMLAMTAARLGEPEKAVDALFIESPKNRYLANGHNYQSSRLPLYLPGNGGLLTAVAMMAAGWDGCPPRPCPGFPNNGQWNIRWEGLRPMP